MQELMSRHKAYSLSPRDCLKTTLFQKWQRMVAPPEAQRPPSKRRKRKSSATNAGPTSGPGKKKNANNAMSPGPPNFSLASQDVMVVGEPSLMGGEFGDEDERLITRLENNQFDPNAGGPSNGIEENEGFSDMSAQQGPPNPGQPIPQTSSHWPPNIPPPPTSTPSSCPAVTAGTPGGFSNGSSDDKKASPVNQ